MKTILAADTTTAVNTVALCAFTDDPDSRAFCVRTEVYTQCGRRHAERLVSTVDWVLRESGLSLGDVDLLALSNGPGSFTGLRIGASTFKGLAFGASKPLVAVPTLDAMARAAQPLGGDPLVICPLLDARMREVFGALYRFEGGKRQKLTADRVCPVEDLLRERSGPVVVFGEGAQAYRDRIAALGGDICIRDDWSVPRAWAVAAEAVDLLAAGAVSDAGLLSPVYLRQSQAEVNRALAAKVPAQ